MAGFEMRGGSMRRGIPALLVPFLFVPLLLAQPPKSAPDSPPDRARLQQVIDAWATLDPSNAAVYYAKDAGLAFYDIAPLKYTGWTEYENGTREMFKTMQSLSFKVNDDAQVHRVGDIAWSAATLEGKAVMRDGSQMPLHARWTTVWEKRGNQWLIVHDHFSAPLEAAGSE